MFQLKRKGGFTIVELLVGISVVGVLLAVGIPAMASWLVTNRARSASEFYNDGLATARRQALMHNAHSRFVLAPNADNGQLDWRVDVCFPTPGNPCDEDNPGWSTETTAAANDPEGSKGFKSVARNSKALPDSTVIVPSLLPEGATTIYYNELGWVDTTIPNRVARIRLDPTTPFKGSVASVALVISLAGMPSKCDPTKSGTDVRACPL